MFIMNHFSRIIAFCALFILLLSVVPSFAQEAKAQGYILEHEKTLAADQPGPHNGLGTTTGYSFFAKAEGLKLVFRKRVLHPGSSIGYHLQTEDEIYYVISGKGEMKENDKLIPMNPGDAILTRPGSSHGLTQVGKDDLVILISYEQKVKE
jgi:mannose-6-phosphate isomerase-like protein (cupin superfamily)